ncbi:MAG: ABC transporter permease, partial [Dehalococcoidales bacterium]|nr:ABC transporter permease [Dehalococcoidales bacterium]
LPGDPIYMLMSMTEVSSASLEKSEEIRREYGLDQPIMVQYFNWLVSVFHGDFGISIVQKLPVLSMVKSGFPITLNLALPAFIISMLIGVPAGIICAIRRGKFIDTLVTVIANIGITIPVFWLGIMLIYLFSTYYGWLPVQGYVSPFEDLGDNIQHLILPIFCLSIFPLAATARQARSSMLEVMHQDYIRTAWSKGLREQAVVLKHALKNSFIPVLTLSGVLLSYAIGGSVLVEMVFNIQGVGRMLVNAVMGHDYPVVQGFVLFIAIMVLFINILVDISYGWLDPRIRYE